MHVLADQFDICWSVAVLLFVQMCTMPVTLAYVLTCLLEHLLSYTIRV